MNRRATNRKKQSVYVCVKLERKSLSHRNEHFNTSPQASAEKKGEDWLDVCVNI